MKLTEIKKILSNSDIAFFEVDKNNYIKWKNHSFIKLFNFIESKKLNGHLTFQHKSQNNFLILKFIKKNISYKIDLLVKRKNNSIYKINDSQISKLKVLQDGMNCFKKGEIKFAIQKQYDLNKSKISGYEFLARMYLQNGTLISNEDFMPMIDSTYQLKILIPIALSKISNIKKHLKNKIYWINVSCENLEQKSFYKIFSNLVKKNNLENKNIGIEITESNKIKSNKNILDTLLKLKANKFLIAMDDFGAGYANIKRLSIFPVDIVKLDKLFVSDIKNKKTQLLIKGIAEIGNKIGFSLLAEGIETNDDLMLIKRMGVKFGQGYFLGKPEIM